MFINDWTRSQIELPMILARVAPTSEYGARRLRERAPFVPGQEAEHADDAADVRRIARMESKPLTQALAQLGLIDDAIGVLRGGQSLTAEQCARLKRFAHATSELHAALARSGQDPPPWWDPAPAHDVLALLSAPAAAAVGGATAVAPDFSLGDLARSSADDGAGAQWLALSEQVDRLQASERAIVRARAAELTEEYAVPMRRDRTFVFATDHLRQAQAHCDARLELRFSTPFETVFALARSDEEAALTRELSRQQELLAQQERELLRIVSRRLSSCAHELTLLCQRLGRLDEVLARAVLLALPGMTQTQCASRVTLLEGRHPLYPEFMPVSAELGKGLAILTGPNMGGKTALQKTLLALQCCHQWGIPVPAHMFCAPLFGAVRYVGGDAQSLGSGLSSFAAEVEQLAETLRLTATVPVFACCDELGRSTNPREGEVLLQALADICAERSERGSCTVLATHVALACADCTRLRIRGIDLQRLVRDLSAQTQDERRELLAQAMDYTVEVVSAAEPVPQQALVVAALLGLDEQVIARAHQLMQERRVESP